MVSNAQKWKQPNSNTRIKINLSCIDENILEILFSDDGVGLMEKFSKASDSIFELGVYAMPPNPLDYGSSGIGLYYTRKILEEKFSGSIKFIGNNLKYNGATFQLKICK